MALIYDKIVASVHDKTLVLAVREQVVQPFQAPDWMDLRVGFLLSLVDENSDPPDTIAALQETIPDTPEGRIPVQDRYWIGVKTRGESLPGEVRSAFIGFSNANFRGSRDFGDSKLQSSDAAVGTTNTNFWRVSNGLTATALGGIFDGSGIRVSARMGCEQHFAQNTVGAGGYATLFMLRLQRDGPQSTRITVTTKTSDTHSGNVLFTNTPTKDLLLTNLEAFPATVQTWGPTQLSFAVPDALFAYWPYHQSRLRIHCWGILRVA